MSAPLKRTHSAQFSAAFALQQQGQLDQAALLYEAILSAQPQHFDALQMLAIIKTQGQQFSLAVDLFERALAINPHHPGLHNNHGNALREWKKPAAALASYDRALLLQADYAQAYANRGHALLDLQLPAQALDSYERMFQLAPADAAAYCSRGNALLALQRLPAALASFEQALVLDPGYVSAHFNRSLCCLLMGDFACGWQEYEWRWEKEKKAYPSALYACPLWLGKEDLRGKTILLYCEQGLGDTIQFCRYVQQVATLGARVILQVQAPLLTFLRNITGAAQVVAQGASLPAFDYHCPLMSLPLAFQTELATISKLPYLHADAQKCAQWRLTLPQTNHKKIGLMWRGNAENNNDILRSIPFEAWKDVLDVAADFYCLQQELPASEQVLLSQTRLTFFGEVLHDFSDTAALIASMDLVITVDTSVAHVAAAMGKPVWILLAFNPDFRWLLEREDSPWYGSVRLFRQPTAGDWSSVLAQVASALEQLSMMPAAAAPTDSAKMNTALALHQQGQFAQAEVLYKEILQAQPDHINALQLLATSALQRGDFIGAVMLFDQAIQLNAGHAGMHKKRGHALCGLQRWQPALASYERALQIDPDDSETHYTCGFALRELKRLPEALASYGQALLLKPEHAEAHNNRGSVLRELKQPAAALSSYERALQLNPSYATVHNNRGSALADLLRPDEALDSYTQALLLQPDYAEAHYNQGNVLLSLKQPERALASLERALQLQPDYPEAYHCYGNAWYALQRPAQALHSYAQALRLKPDYTDVHNNQGNAWCKLNQTTQALASFEQALLLDPQYADARMNQALCWLLTADFSRGWPAYEWRWKTEKGLGLSRNFTQNLWLGKEDLHQKTILLHSEQGSGDTLQFCRYVRQVAMLGANVILQVPALLTAFLHQLGDVAIVLGLEDSLPAFDYHCPLMSLPFAFQTDLASISGLPYLHAEPQKCAQWQALLPQNTQLKVGLAWCGSATHENDGQRSIPFDAFSVLCHEDAAYYCLQTELRPLDQAVLADTPVQFMGHALHDFSDTAALIASLDLVITVDTSVAHLAAAMGKPVWILLPFNPDFRWLLEREDSPWYGSARLFRQPAIGDWDSVLARVALELQQLILARANNAKLTFAFALQQDAQLESADLLYQEILQSQPRHFDALQMRASIALQRRDFGAAITLFDQALEINSQHASALHNRGNALYGLRQLPLALLSFEQALQLDPDCAGSHFNRGNVLHDLKQLEAALASFDRVRELQPDHGKVHYCRANVLHDLQRLLPALDSFDLALRFRPDHADAWNNRGIVLFGLKRFQAALDSYDQALRFNPDRAHFYSNRGNALSSLSRLAEALASFERALQLRPDYVSAHNNRGVALRDLTRMDEALASFERALQLEPEHADAHFNESLCRLSLGDLTLGWQQYEWRWKLPKYLPRQFDAPLWLGQESLQGKTILLHSEQGLGDTIQFCRYAAQVAALGARVTLQVPASLVALLGQLEGVALVLSEAASVPPCDYHTPLMSLPLACQTDWATISNLPYLQADAQKYAQWQLPESTRLKVGLVWSGNAVLGNDGQRSIALAALDCLFDDAIDYYGLQTELRPQDRARLAQTPVQLPAGVLQDFSDTAALIAQMDVVITVDTSVAHLAGAMGKAVWILLPFNPDWRWMLERRDSPWYGSAKLFRQQQMGDWRPVLEQVGLELKQLIRPVP